MGGHHPPNHPLFPLNSVNSISITHDQLHRVVLICQILSSIQVTIEQPSTEGSK